MNGVRNWTVAMTHKVALGGVLTVGMFFPVAVIEVFYFTYGANHS
jgi:hypothetical protein